jgi:hypothetical protein
MTRSVYRLVERNDAAILCLPFVAQTPHVAEQAAEGESLRHSLKWNRNLLHSKTRGTVERMCAPKGNCRSLGQNDWRLIGNPSSFA